MKKRILEPLCLSGSVTLAALNKSVPTGKMFMKPDVVGLFGYLSRK
jgi:hypothetical protein